MPYTCRVSSLVCYGNEISEFIVKTGETKRGRKSLRGQMPESSQGICCKLGTILEFCLGELFGMVAWLLSSCEPSLHSERKGPSWRRNPVRLWSTCSRWLSTGLGQWNSLREHVLVCFKRRMNIFKALPGIFFCFLLVHPRRPSWKKEL